MISRLMKYINLKNIIIFTILFPIWFSSVVNLYENRQKIQNKITSTYTEPAVTPKEEGENKTVRWLSQVLLIG